MAKASKFSTQQAVKTLVIGSGGNTLEYVIARMDAGTIRDDNTARCWAVQSTPVSMMCKAGLKAGEIATVYLVDDTVGSTVTLDRLDDGGIIEKMDSRSVARVINDTKIMDVFDSEVSKRQLWVNLIMGFIIGGLLIGMIILLFVK